MVLEQSVRSLGKLRTARIHTLSDGLCRSRCKFDLGIKGRCQDAGCPETHDKCDSDDQCIHGGYCAKGKCRSGAAGEACSSDDQCFAGGYCERGTCYAGDEKDKCSSEQPRHSLSRSLPIARPLTDTRCPRS